MNGLIYSLYQPKENTNQFYQELSVFTDLVLSQCHSKFDIIVEDFISFIRKNNLEKCRTTEEYLIEALSIGIYWQVYGVNAVCLKQWQGKLLAGLYGIRNKSQKLKPHIDKLRGILATRYLLKTTCKTSINHNLDVFDQLLIWLRASGEFKEEVERFENWQLFLSRQSYKKVRQFLSITLSLAAKFQTIGQLFIGKYTKGVNRFRKNTSKIYKNREDAIFCHRSEVEYHLNMVAAEILNRKLKTAFNRTDKKLVLLPTCVRISNDHCQAIMIKGDLTCQQCNKNCNVYKITNEVTRFGHRTVLIPHSSGFSEYLKKWENTTSYGLVGVACVLNLLTGGYEMKKLNIPSQCIYLDYCGCSKHWYSKGIPTNLNIDQLSTILSKTI